MENPPTGPPQPQGHLAANRPTGARPGLGDRGQRPLPGRLRLTVPDGDGERIEPQPPQDGGVGVRRIKPFEADREAAQPDDVTE
ncbi:MAG: hypothetical protein QN178_14030 [Armatimonadota bacterium]|nr:hypothetical protein [Armatimonadota bacterium]